MKAVGPTIPSIYLDKRLEDDKEYGHSMFDATIDVCMEWLNQRRPGSVIYISFGSLAQLTVQQTQQLAQAIKLCDKHFLWVIRSSEESKLPPKFLEETSLKGLIVSWCQQLEVLAHDSIGCFITHCGWNSTLEAMSLGVPLVAMPQWTDQSTNTKFITDVWGTGVRARADENGLVSQDEIVACVNNVMEGDDGEVIKLNCMKWRKLVREAVDDGGSSDKNIDEFVCALLNRVHESFDKNVHDPRI